MVDQIKIPKNVLTAAYKFTEVCEQAGLLPLRVSLIEIRVFRNNEGRVIPDAVGGKFGMINRKEMTEELESTITL